MPTLDIDYKNFIAGESQSDDITDRGFSPNSYNLNLTKKRGMLYFQEAGTERGGETLTDNIIAACNDGVFNGNDAYLLDASGACYTYDGTTLTKKQTSLHNYAIGTSDMIFFKNDIYITSQWAIVKLDNDFNNLANEWWVGLDTSFRHPMERVEDELFIANKNVVYYWNGTTSGTAFTLPTDTNVTSLRKHPDGRTLLAFCGLNADYSHLRNNTGRVYYCDPIIRDWTREVEIETQVEGTRLHGGIVYCTYGNKFGYFNGSGLKFLKKLVTSATTYSHCISNMEDILLFRDGTNVVSFGDLGAGMVWWKSSANLTTTDEISCLFYKGDNKLLISYPVGAAGDLDEIDYDNALFSGDFYSNRYNFGQTVKIRRIDIVSDPSHSAGSTLIYLYYTDTDGNTNSIDEQLYSTSTSQKRINCDITTDMFQLKVDPANDDIGYKLFRIHYDAIK